MLGLNKLALRDRAKLFITVMFTFLFLVFYTKNVHAVTYDVCSTCTYTTIQSAIEAIPADETATIRLNQGTYNERIVINTSKIITLQGGWNSDFSQRSKDPALTTITAARGPGIVTAEAGAGESIRITLQGLKIAGNAFGNYELGGGIRGVASGGGQLSLHVDSCLVTGNSAEHGFGAGIGLGSIGAGSLLDFTMDSTRISENSVVFYNGGGMFFRAYDSGVINSTLTNNIISNNSALYAGGIGIEAEVLFTSLITGTVNFLSMNNTITNNLAWSYGMYGGGNGGGMMINGLRGTVNAVLKNTILRGNTAQICGTDLNLDRSGGGTLHVDVSYSNIGSNNCDVYNEPADPADYLIDTSVLSMDPLFVKPSAGDYHLQSVSPMIDAGTPSGAPSADFEGSTRPAVTGIDIGAYEFVPEFTITKCVYDVATGVVNLTWNNAAGKTYDLQYSDDPYSDTMTWTKLQGDITSGAGGITSFTDDGTKIGTAPGDPTVVHRYYRVAIVGMDPAVYTNDWCGIFSTRLVDGMNLVSLPVIPESTLLHAAIGNQLRGDVSPGLADRIWFWNRTTRQYEYAWLSSSASHISKPWRSTSGGWPESPLSLDSDKGFWIQIRTGHGNKYLKLCGLIAASDQVSNIITGMQIISSPYPVSVNLNDALNSINVTEHGSGSPGTADRIWYWNRTTQQYEYAWLSTSVGKEGWRSTASGWPSAGFSLTPGHGYWLQVRDNHPDFSWTFSKPYVR